MIPGSANPLLLATAAGAGGYAIERSLRFNSSDSAYCSFTPASAGNRKTWTWAGWVKRGALGTEQSLFTAWTDDSNRTIVRFSSGDALQFLYQDAGTFYGATTNSIYRDASAWYHLVFALDTANATSASRVKLYVNGTEVTALTAFGSGIYPPQNTEYEINATVEHLIAARRETGSLTSTYLNGYLADIHFIDGQALDPTSFGEFDDNGIWQPKAFAGSYGTNGFHLDFADNSSNTATTLGKDTSGNGNDWMVNNIDVNPTDPPSLIIGDYLGTVTSASYTLTNTEKAFDGTQGFLNSTWTSSGIGNADTITWTPGSNVTVPAGYNMYFAIYYKTTNSNNRFFRFSDASGTPGAEVAVSNSNYSESTNYWTDVTAALPAANPDGSRTFSAFRYRDTVAFSGQFPRWYNVVIATSPPNDYNFPTNVTYLVDDYWGSKSNPGNDSLVDVPTNGAQTDTGAGGEVRGNYCTWNPLNNPSVSATLSNGNLDVASTTSSFQAVTGTLFPTSGKWYIELVNTVTASDQVVGIAAPSFVPSTANNRYIGRTADSYGFYSDGRKINNNVFSAYGNAWSVNDVLRLAFDLDNGKVWLGINGTWQASGDPAAGTNAAFTGLSGGFSVACSPYLQSVAGAFTLNAGQRPFAYTAPSGFKALNTANLPAPLVTKPSDVMDVALYTGTGSANTRTVSFSPDFVWVKPRSNANPHQLFDTVRGDNARLKSDSTDAEYTYPSGAGLTFGSTGFTVGTDNGLNQSGESFVAWAWDAGTTTTTNTVGSISSQVRANASAGFSVVTWTFPASGAFTVGHGLGVAPYLVITKPRSVTNNWNTYHFSTGATGQLRLNRTDAVTTGSTLWDSTAPTSSVFSIGSAYTSAVSNATAVAYCFAPVAGYSSFGSYTGNGSADGPFVFLNFRARWIMFKRVAAADPWIMYDTARSQYNQLAVDLAANDSRAEAATSAVLDITSNGFKLRNSGTIFNQSGSQYIYCAFAESPFQYARAR
jgi:hypothetical protein